MLTSLTSFEHDVSDAIGRAMQGRCIDGKTDNGHRRFKIGVLVREFAAKESQGRRRSDGRGGSNLAC